MEDAGRSGGASRNGVREHPGPTYRERPTQFTVTMSQLGPGRGTEPLPAWIVRPASRSEGSSSVRAPHAIPSTPSAAATRLRIAHRRYHLGSAAVGRAPLSGIDASQLSFPSYLRRARHWPGPRCDARSALRSSRSRLPRFAPVRERYPPSAGVTMRRPSTRASPTWRRPMGRQGPPFRRPARPLQRADRWATAPATRWRRYRPSIEPRRRRRRPLRLRGQPARRHELPRHHVLRSCQSSVAFVCARDVRMHPPVAGRPRRT
jgi:hypothetical protein